MEHCTAELDSPATRGDNACVDAVNRDCGESQFAALRHEHRKPCGRNSVVECRLPKLDAVGLNPFARYDYDGVKELPDDIVYRRYRERP